MKFRHNPVFISLKKLFAFPVPRSSSPEFKKPAEVVGRDKKKEEKKKKKKEAEKEKGEPEVKKRKRVDVRELFAKRTVGKAFDEALQRYYRRKSLGISGLKRGLG